MPGADFDERRQASADRDLTACRRGDARQNFHDRRLAGSIVSDNTQRLAFINSKADVAESPHLP